MDPLQAGKYIQVARSLNESAAALDTLAGAGDHHGNAIAILAVHSAIAYADALSIAYGGFKSTEGEHEKAVDVLKDALGHRADAPRVRTLLQIIKRKDTASYQGVYYSVEEARALIEKLKIFASWAEQMYDQRP